ncbi:hypothetical protein CRG98_003444 [Punica granatum]|uniref:Uncharacterized protein n=1 Tax=Punica granatum TaxID=22663 RepID=A0A2I0L637_PUNGR|nr:hypothetical protein CRG98_003444 [Punica granatum]
MVDEEGGFLRAKQGGYVVRRGRSMPQQQYAPPSEDTVAEAVWLVVVIQSVPSEASSSSMPAEPSEVAQQLWQLSRRFC